MNKKKIGDKLRVARESMGMTQEMVSISMGLPRTAITKIENGDRDISSLELAKLAKLYYRSINFFFNDDNNDDLLVELHRVAPGLDNNPEVRQQVNMCIDLCREGVVLENILGSRERAYLPSHGDIIAKSAWEAIKQGEQFAREERRRLGLGFAPIGDIAELISKQNIWTSSANFPDSMSGLFINHDNIGLAIFINSKHGRARKRFSFAHEYAHALFDRNRNQFITVSSEDNKTEIIEKRANAFAAEFLMPEEGIRELLKAMDKGAPSREEKMLYDVASEKQIRVPVRNNSKSQQITYQDLTTFAYHFGVSYQVALYRLNNLSLITQNEFAYLHGLEELGKEYFKAFGMFEDLEGYKIEEYKDRELRNQILRLSIEAYRQELISKGRLIELGKLLNIPSEKIIEFAEAA